MSYWHETTQGSRLLVPDLSVYQWVEEENAEWKTDDTYRSLLRLSCPLSDTPKLTLFSASKLPGDRHASWLAFESQLVPEGVPDWYTPDACLAAGGLLSFLTGKRLPFLWLDRFQEDSHLTRTYRGTAKVDDLRYADQGYQPVPFRSVQDGGGVVAALPALYASYSNLRKWYDLDWIVGPLWYAITAYLDDKLGLASVSVERFATAHDAFLEANSDHRRPKVKFLTRMESRTLRGELSGAVAAFAKRA